MKAGKHVKTKAKVHSIGCCVIIVCLVSVGYGLPAFGESSLGFKSRLIEDDANLWWARALGDINEDGLLDLVLQNNNGHGGWLGWYEARNGGRSWERHIIAQEAPGGGTFACGDMDVGDIDNDGDLDILGFKHPGEWDSGGDPTEIYWYENPNWKHHYIGQAPDFIKDLNLADFNQDGKLDLVVITYQENKLAVFRQDSPASWVKVQEFKIDNLHEGMDVGDIDGDGDPDVAANGYWIESPGGDLVGDWKIHDIDAKWHNQNGDWSKNGTKVFCRDITGDGRAEVFISHSERKGYPVSWYQAADPRKGPWTEHVIVEEMPAAHTLQVLDMDGDGDHDVLAGVNRSRAKALDVKKWPVIVYLNQGDGRDWKEYRITDEGIYNGQIGDLEGDGDYDIFRLPTHDATTFEVLMNQTRQSNTAQKYRRLSLDDYRDKMKAGWIGQMVGVGWGGPTEFRWKGEIIPADKMPKWKPETVNQFHQDDIYVEMTFLRSLEVYGLDVSIRQAGIDFANSEYPLWHANRAGRANLRDGIAPPDSGHPQFNKHADDIDYQIEADFAGLIAPALPNTVIELGNVFGRVMNYGDGLYGGHFVGGMYAEAFFEDDPVKLVEAGLRCIPRESKYAETIRDVLAWYGEEPDDWEKTWDKINRKYHLNRDNRRFSCSGADSDFNIDAKINGAYIVMGLLYGKGDLDRTVIISTRCGQDSDCNPSNAGGVLFTTVGFKNLPSRFVSALNEEEYFSHTAYNFAKLIAVCEKTARQAVIQAGGEIEKDSAGKETFVIPVIEPKPGKIEQCWEPGPVAGSRFTEEEMKKIKF